MKGRVLWKKDGVIVSTIMGSVFFAVPYLVLGIGAIPAAICGLGAYGAGLLLTKENNKLVLSKNISPDNKEILQKAYATVKEIEETIPKLENSSLKADIKSICDKSNKIINALVKEPTKIKKVRNFLNYYLPVTLKVLQRYDEIENQKISTKDTQKFMSSVENTISNINQAFVKELNNVYQNEIVDTDADLKVIKTMLKSDGLLEDVNLELKEDKKENK